MASSLAGEIAAATEKDDHDGGTSVKLLLDCSQFAVKAVLGVIDLKAILENKFCVLGSGAQLGMSVVVT